MNSINSDLINELSKYENIDDAITFLRKQGINLNEEEVKKYVVQELSDDDLDKVSGGVNFLGYLAQFLAGQVRTKIVDGINGNNEKGNNNLNNK